MAARIEAAAPLPAGFAGRIAGALRDRADLDVAVINAPRLLRGIGVAGGGSAEAWCASGKTEMNDTPQRARGLQFGESAMNRTRVPIKSVDQHHGAGLGADEVGSTLDSARGRT
jgi:hypothetical protein